MSDVSEIFQLDKSNYPTREVIKVVGVGGAGDNALNHIVRGGVRGVEFIAANTDIAHLELSRSVMPHHSGQRNSQRGSEPVPTPR